MLMVRAHVNTSLFAGYVHFSAPGTRVPNYTGHLQMLGGGVDAGNPLAGPSGSQQAERARPGTAPELEELDALDPVNAVRWSNIIM